MNMIAPPAVTVRTGRWLGLPLAMGIVAATLCLHIALGAKFVPLDVVFEALTHRDPANFNHTIVWDLRLPRALVAIIVGASLSVAGALMQGVTRNPLAEPGILGLMAGASFAVVFGIGMLGLAGNTAIPMMAAGGSLGAACLVYLISRWVPGGATPLTLTLAGAVVTAFLGALTSVAFLLRENAFDSYRVWLSGSLAGRDLSMLMTAGPVLIVALVVAFALARQITALAMGEEVALALGVRTGWLKAQLLVCVVALTAGSVALAGPLGFVGLVIPHAVRLFTGSDYRWIVPYSAVVGAGYLLAVDVAARMMFRPAEISTGIVTALIGAPIFVYLIRKRSR
ncbi:iron ABC transporter permease [Devosia sp. 2618]|uniref:FecCD family ABC transporter permease n=1 Tax=Devosia sp. 2618 TaxID=3156454 RepID=UPI0033973346